MPMLLLGVLFSATAVLLLPIMLFGNKKKHDFSGQHVIITGGSTGIGLALADELARAGARLTLIARSAGKLAEAKAKIIRDHPETSVHVVSADVTQMASVGVRRR